jgi:hypothetical protein
MVAVCVSMAAYGGADAGRGAGSSEQPAERRRRGCRQAEQRERDGTWECNDRLIGVAVKARARTRSLNPQPGMRDEVEALFGHDNQLADKDFRLRRSGDAETARALVRHGNKASSGAQSWRPVSLPRSREPPR